MELIPCELARLVINDNQSGQVLLLREMNGTRRLPIIIGIVEAWSIRRRLSAEEEFPRPLTDDLFILTVEALGARLERVEVTDLQEGTYFAALVLAREDGEPVRVDARPSDAIGLAVRAGCPILVAEGLLEPEEGSAEG